MHTVDSRARRKCATQREPAPRLVHSLPKPLLIVRRGRPQMLTVVYKARDTVRVQGSGHRARRVLRRLGRGGKDGSSWD